MTSSTDSLVIIPTYNEKENVAAIIDATMGLPHEMDVLIIDDGSPDGTAAIVKRKMEIPGGCILWSAPESWGSARHI